MFLNRNTAYVLIGLGAFALSACSSLSPAHFGKFTFQGTVTDESGKPVPNAWVKVRGWETLTDSSGKWQQVQVVNCGTLREHMDTYEENDAILVTAEGFQPNEEKFIVKHPGWFQSCQAEQTLILDSILKTESGEVRANKQESKKITPPKESPAMPWPTPQEQVGKKKKGAYSL